MASLIAAPDLSKPSTQARKRSVRNANPARRPGTHDLIRRGRQHAPRHAAPARKRMPRQHAARHAAFGTQTPLSTQRSERRRLSAHAAVLGGAGRQKRASTARSQHAERTRARSTQRASTQRASTREPNAQHARAGHAKGTTPWRHANQLSAPRTLCSGIVSERWALLLN